jgi:hypothetical protein
MYTQPQLLDVMRRTQDQRGIQTQRYTVVVRLLLHAVGKRAEAY